VCTRVPDPSRPGKRVTKVWEVDATTNAITELAGHLAGLGVEKVTAAGSTAPAPLPARVALTNSPRSRA